MHTSKPRGNNNKKKLPFCVSEAHAHELTAWFTKYTHTQSNIQIHMRPQTIYWSISREGHCEIYINAFQCVSHLMSRTAATESIVRSVRALVAEVTTCVCACVCRFLLSISYSPVAKTAPNVLPTDNLAHEHAPANVCDRIALKLERLSSQRTHIHTHTHIPEAKRSKLYVLDGALLRLCLLEAIALFVRIV